MGKRITRFTPVIFVVMAGSPSVKNDLGTVHKHLLGGPDAKRGP